MSAKQASFKQASFKNEPLIYFRTDLCAKPELRWFIWQNLTHVQLLLLRDRTINVYSEAGFEVSFMILGRDEIQAHYGRSLGGGLSQWGALPIAETYQTSHIPQ